MIHREKDFENPPSGLYGSSCNSLKDLVLVEKNGHEAKLTCYRNQTIDELVELYKNKCAICERVYGMELQVDHYRPRKKRDNKDKTKYNHPGYYWLTYEWSNLIPLCSKCNGHKSNKFPLVGFSEENRIDSHENTRRLEGFKPYSLEWLQQYEKPLLINPEFDKAPERHFIFRNDGSVDGRTDEGEETINICRLNRKDLKRERLEIRKEYLDIISEAFDEFVSHQNSGELKGELKVVFRKIKRGCDIDRKHSLYHIYLYRYFDYMIASRLSHTIREKANQYFSKFKSPNVIH